MKRFYNNTLIGGAFSKALRVVALLCVLLGISGNAWGAYYLHYNNTGSHTKDVGASDLKWTDGVEPVDNVCTWTISTSAWDNYVYIMSSKTNKTILDITGATISNKSSNIDFGNISDHNSKKLFYFKQKSAKQITITITYNLSTKVITLADGSAGTCTPSATITGASYDGTKITLSGTVTEVCTSSIVTWYGWQYKTDVNADWSTSTYIEGKGKAGSNQHQTTTSPLNYTNTWTGFEEGKTYYFRAYALQGSTWYSDNKILSVTIPKGGGSTGEADCSGVVYLDPNIYVGDDAWFAAYFFGNEDIWVEMTPACDGLYKAMIPDGATGVTFVRKNPADKTLESWNNKWNQTVDLQIQTNKYFKVENWNASDGKETGTWYDTDCTDGCIPAEQPSTNVLLSREAIVNKSAKTAQLFGYLKSIKAPDCPTSEIADYGFFYCMVNDGDTPCTPTPTSSSTKIAADPSPALSRGMEFTATVGLIKEPSDALQDGKTYYYRAYAKIDDKYILSGEIRSFSTDPCIPQYGGLSDKYNGKPIVYTINADPSFAANDCKLHFNSLQAAIDHLKATNTKDDDFKYVTLNNGSYNLNQPVEMRVVYYDDTPDDNTKTYIYRGKEIGENESFVYAGDDKPANANLIQDFNKSGADAKNTLSIKAGSDKAKPWIHHIVIRNSKNILLDSLCIYSDPKDYDATKAGNQLKSDNALEIDINTTKWNMIEVQSDCNSYTRSDNDGSLTFTNMCDANIVVQNCMIGSAGFTGLHLSAYDGITFKNNEFEAIFSAQADNNVKHRNMINYGASAKFVACKNIKFIQNNFRGSHPTLMWLQECQNVLIMNNVFWYTNELDKKNASDANADTPDNAALRLVHQFGAKDSVENVAAYYNTFYVAETDVKDKYNFLYFSNTVNNNSSSNAKFKINTIYFKYNNCYSYDSGVPGRSNSSKTITDNNRQNAAYIPEPFLGKDVATNNFCPNNFWSEYDQIEYNKLAEDKKASYVSAFAFGCTDNEFINVKSQVCSTTASGPASLIVKGKGMDYGVKPDISTTGITLEPNEQYADRYIIGARPANGEKWTYGAYQSKDEITTQTIYWVGVSSDWDDRNNWEYETEVDGKMVRQRVSCINTLSEDLKVVIEEIGTVEIAGGRKWPQVPASFTENRTNSEYDEHVSAGLGTGKTPTKFASTIELEYGAGLRGVENLNDGTMRYDQAIVHFDAERNKWLLVGPIIRPFDTEKNDGTTRNVNSGDYFRNFEPQIYMHGTVVDGNTISWGKTFGDLNVNVTPDTVFAINASVLYGKYYDTAEDYLKYEGIKVDDKAPIPYRFTGRFAVEEYETEGAYQYTLKKTNDKNLINNVYPCNLDAKYIEEQGFGTINVYDYNIASFVSTSEASPTGNVYIKAQNGFVFTPNEGKQLKLTNDILAEGSTRTRAGEIPLPTFSLNVDNANTTKPGASNIVVRYDEFLGTSEESLLNTPKVFTRNSDTPEAYIIHNDGKYTRLDAGKEKVTIPLGVRLMKPMNLTFEKVYNEGYDEVVLVDTKTQKFYNLLKRTYTTDVLSEGDTEGRFYLNLTVSGDDDLDDEGDNPGGDDIVDDDDVSTEVEETIEEPQINIYTVDNSIVRVSSVGTVLKTIYVSDMTGRTDEYSVDGNYVELQLPVSSGVYTVTVVGETASKIGKVILK